MLINCNFLNVQASNYKALHRTSAHRFNDVQARLITDGTIRGRLTPMTHMSATTLKHLLEPLRKLRLNCTLSSLMVGNTGDDGRVGNSAATTAVTVPSARRNSSTNPFSGFGRRLLSTVELHRHLIAKHQENCRNMLRSLADSFNLEAELHAISNNYAAACDSYQLGLQLASEYSASSSGDICVDRMLQIHALHNWLEMYELSATAAAVPADPTGSAAVKSDRTLIESMATAANEATKENYNAQLLQLQEDFKAQKIADVAARHETVMAARAAVAEMHRRLPEMPTERDNRTEANRWWAELFGRHMDNNAVAAFKACVRGALVKSLSEKLPDSSDDITSMLVQWFERREKLRTEIADSFDRLNVVAPMMRRWSEMGDAASGEKDAKAIECHLHKSTVEACQSCRLREALKRYKCVLYDKMPWCEGMIWNEGSCVPPMQEMILQCE